MDLKEARALLAEFVSPYRGWKRTDLEKLVDREISTRVVGKSRAEYRFEMFVTAGSTRDPTLVVSGEATDATSVRWIKQRATVGFSVLEDGSVAFESGFFD